MSTKDIDTQSAASPTAASSLPPRVRFLTLAEVIAIHAEVLTLHGGADGLWDEGALRSAIAQPEQSFEDEYLHSTLPEMAAAYVFHISQNHPFVDGNKRTGLLSAVTFVFLNNQVVVGSKEEIEALVIGVAEHRFSKADLVSWFRRYILTPTWPNSSLLCIAGPQGG